MPTKDTAKALEEFINLVPKKGNDVAAKFRSGRAKQPKVAEMLDELSKVARQSASDVTKTIRGLPKREREELLSRLENSGVIEAARVLTPAFRSQNILDDCLLLHEAAKVLHTAAEIIDVWKPEKGTPVWVKILMSGLLAASLAADILAQICDDKDAKLLEQKINFIMDLPDGVDVPAVPADETPTSLTTLRKLLEVAKKFYKFEGFFTPTFRKDKQLIRIGPLATSTLPSPPVPILVTGLIDLGGMQNHDVVTITTKVLEPTPSPQYVIWRVKTFTGPQSSGIKHFQDFADLLEVPGDGVEVLIAQSASSHNFDPAFLLTIPYQFLVETTVLPDFNVS